MSFFPTESEFSRAGALDHLPRARYATPQAGQGKTVEISLARCRAWAFDLEDALHNIETGDMRDLEVAVSALEALKDALDDLVRSSQ